VSRQPAAPALALLLTAAWQLRRAATSNCRKICCINVLSTAYGGNMHSNPVPAAAVPVLVGCHNQSSTANPSSTKVASSPCRQFKLEIHHSRAICCHLSHMLCCLACV
jgi:hypothetical protein